MDIAGQLELKCHKTANQEIYMLFYLFMVYFYFIFKTKP